MAAMAPESEQFASSWYYSFAKHPYVERFGVNSGVTLMNLTRMRAYEWHNYLEPYLSQ
jgi:UDP-xylose:glucoside alpha-1,3-xylosyltransferase